jgi:hypothetical protein
MCSLKNDYITLAQAEFILIPMQRLFHKMRQTCLYGIFAVERSYLLITEAVVMQKPELKQN